jgi:hypothetical protein
MGGRRGGILVTAAIVTTIAILNGYRLIAIVLGVCLIAIGVIVSRLLDSADDSKLSSRAPALQRRFTYSDEWSLTASPDVASVKRGLAESGLQVADEAEALVVSRGSRIRARVFGGYRVDPSFLPLHGRIEVMGGEQGSRYGVHLTLEDDLGPAVRDDRLAERYDRSFSDVALMVRLAVQA